MGTLQHFSLDWIRESHGLKSFVETGTGEGAAVRQALLSGFKSIHSIELVPELAAAARAKFSRHPEVHIHCGESAELLTGILKQLPEGPALFWLDAHFPGADYGMGEYEGDPDVGRRLPLAREVEVIKAARKGERDVILIDDARIYQPGPYGSGNLPDNWPPLAGLKRSLDFVKGAFAATHGIVIDYRDQGYVMVTPHAT